MSPRRRHLTQGELIEGEVTVLSSPAPKARLGEHEARVLGGVPGDRGTFRVVHAGKNVIWARIHELSAPSKDRVDAPCEVLDRCGGCPWQAVAPGVQRQARMESVRQALGEHLEGARLHPWIVGPTEHGHRTRALMMARHQGGKLRLGLFAPGTNELVAAEGCPAHHIRITAALDGARKVLSERGVSTWRSPDRSGLLRALLVRVDPESRGALLTLVVSREDPRLGDLGNALLAATRRKGVTGVFANVQPAHGGPVLGPTTVHLAGATHQRVRYGELELEVGPTAFLQTNHAVATLMVAKVSELLPERMVHLVDLYAGVGVFGLALAGRADRVTLVESSPAAVEDALHNVARMGLETVAVVAEDARTGAARVADADAVVVDPPRSGCAPEVLEALCAEGGPKTLVYVACGLRALARDLGVLTDGGWRVTDVVPVDLFAHTAHVEVITKLTR